MWGFNIRCLKSCLSPSLVFFFAATVLVADSSRIRCAQRLKQRLRQDLDKQIADEKLKQATLCATLRACVRVGMCVCACGGGGVRPGCASPTRFSRTAPKRKSSGTSNCRHGERPVDMFPSLISHWKGPAPKQFAFFYRDWAIATLRRHLSRKSLVLQNCFNMLCCWLA